MKVLCVGHDATRTGAPILFLTLLRWFKENTPLQLEILLKNGGVLEPEYARVAWHKVMQVETARLAFDRVEPWPALDSFFDDRRREPDQTRAVLAVMAEPLRGGNLILVTHQVNITALTGIGPAMGELIVLTPQPGGNARIAGRLGPAAFSKN